MDPSQMYEGGGHGTWFWVIYLTVAVLTTVALMGGLLLGIARSYSAPARKARASTAGGAAPASYPADAESPAPVGSAQPLAH